MTRVKFTWNTAMLEHVIKSLSSLKTASLSQPEQSNRKWKSVLKEIQLK
jgi:hypothetical protein